MTISLAKWRSAIEKFQKHTARLRKRGLYSMVAVKTIRTQIEASRSNAKITSASMDVVAAMLNMRVKAQERNGGNTSL